MTQDPGAGGSGDQKEPPRIVHTPDGGLGSPLGGSTDDGTDPPTAPRPKISHFGEDARRHEDSWDRTPNTNGTGAIHVKTFHTKLTDEALLYLDRSINEWLDSHPQYEVKFVTSTIGEFTGKLREPHLVCQVWV